MNRPLFDNRWIVRGLDKHKANYSMVIAFQTDDPVRFEQLRDFFTNPPAGYASRKTYVFDPWNGLSILDPQGELKPCASKVETEIDRWNNPNIYDPMELRGRIRNLTRSLNMMEEKLTQGSAVFIIRGLDTDPQRVSYSADMPHLLYALKAWAISADLKQNNSLVILLGTNISEILDGELRSLIAQVDVEIGSEEEYRQLVTYVSGAFGLSISEDARGAVANALRGLNIHQSEAVLCESYSLKQCFDLDHIKASKAEIVKQTEVLEIEEPSNDFSAIGGYGDVKNFIEQKIIKVIQNPGKAKEFAIPLPRGILFFGPPGTGKTLFAKALASTVKLPFINFRTENILSKWYGQSGLNMKHAIRTSEQMGPAIVFIDEVDRFGRRGSSDTGNYGNSEDRRVFSQMLEWLGDEKRRTIIVGTTNRPEDLDEAFIRAGRFDYKIPLLYPDEEARLQILCIHLGLSIGNRPSPKRKPPLAISEENFKQFLGKIASRTENYSGAELEALVTRAKRAAFDRNAAAVDEEDFENSLLSFHIDVEDRFNQKREWEGLSKRYTDESLFAPKPESHAHTRYLYS